MELSYREIVFKISGEEDIGKLIALNGFVVKRIKLLQSVNRPIPKAPIAQPELVKIIEVKNESNSGEVSQV